jgi:hypothetical protein
MGLVVVSAEARGVQRYVVFGGAWCSKARGVRRRVVFEGAWCSKARGVRRRVVFKGAWCSEACWGSEAHGVHPCVGHRARR